MNQWEALNVVEKLYKIANDDRIDLKHRYAAVRTMQYLKAKVPKLPKRRARRDTA